MSTKHLQGFNPKLDRSLSIGKVTTEIQFCIDVFTSLSYLPILPILDITPPHPNVEVATPVTAGTYISLSKQHTLLILALITT